MPCIRSVAAFMSTTWRRRRPKSSFPAISNFFKEPVLVEVTRVIGWVLIINALAIIPRTIFIRNVEFKVQTKVSLISSIFSGIVGIGTYHLPFS